MNVENFVVFQNDFHRKLPRREKSLLLQAATLVLMPFCYFLHFFQDLQVQAELIHKNVPYGSTKPTENQEPLLQRLNC
jgi:hypothetical protein